MVKLRNLSRVINTCVVLAAAGLSVSGVAYAENANLQNATNEERQQVASNSPVTAPFGIAGLGIAPMVMLTVGREHNLFSEAYSDYTDVDGDGKIDIMFDPSISYYGLFDSNLCYKYQKGTNGLVNAPSTASVKVNYGTYSKFPGYWYPYKKASEKGPVSLDMWADSEKPSRSAKICDGSSWSGNFLNYVTSSRIDVIRKVLYGGARVYSSSKGADLKSGSAKTTKYNGSSLLAHSYVVRDSHSWGKVLADLMYDGKFTVNNFTDLQNTGSAENAWFFVVASPDSPSSSSNDDQNQNTFRWTSTYMRYALVNNAGMPGRAATVNDPAYIWDWASRQTFDQDSNDAIGSANQKRIDRSKKASGSTVTDQSLFSSAVTTKNVAVVACTDEFHDPDSCMNYGTDSEPIWQPVGLLQQYGQGASPRMRFGLITGGWESNNRGGILRANIGDFNSEIRTTSSGGHMAGDYDFSKVACEGLRGDNGKGAICGIIAAFDRMNIAGKQSGSDKNGSNGGGVYTKCSRDLGDNILKMYNEQTGRCHDWGNPVGEMLYETARYFGGRSMYTTDSGFEEDQLKMGHVNSIDPYPDGSSTYCAKPVALLIADENISFDSNEKDSSAYAEDTSAVVSETGAVSNEYGLAAGSYYMGGVRGQDSGMYEFIPSRKQISNLNQVLGLAPAAAFSAGTYNVAGVASLYSKNKLRTTTGPNGNTSDVYMSTYVVAMKPNLPQINIPITTKSGKQVTVEILPFAKTPAESATCNTAFDSVNKDLRSKQSTNQVADFYVEKLNDTEGVFRISYEDFEYGSDYDMDWVVGYKYQVLQGNDGTYVRVMLTHEDGDPYIAQHAGYVITGVEHEGVYVDLGKLSSFRNVSGCSLNLYELDTIINDASIDSCRQLNYWPNGITADGRRGLTQIAESGKGKNWNDRCLFPTHDYSEDSYSGFWNAGAIDNYFKTFIEPHADIYYGNRRTLVNKGYSQYAWFSEKNDGGTIWNYRLHGDHFSSMGRVADKKGTTVTTSRVFKVNDTASESDSGWLKSPLWFAAKYGISKDQNPNRSNPNIEPDNYYLVTNAVKLRDGISDMLNKIDQSFKSGASVIVDVSNGLQSNGYVYGSSYDPSTWYGAVSKRSYAPSGDGSYTYTGVVWNAANTFASATPEERLVMTLDSANSELKRVYAEEIAYDFNNWASNKSSYAASSEGDGALNYLGLDVVRKILNEPETATEDQIKDPDKLVYVDKLIRWVLGAHDYEGQNNSENYSRKLVLNENKPLRYRSESVGSSPVRFVLGDVINSDVTTFTVNGKTFLAVGANDGMLHILDESDGTPVVSYMPAAALSSIGELVKENYNSAHKAYVDSTPVVFEDKTTNKTYLYGTFGLGLRGAYLLNVSNLVSVIGKTPAEKFNLLKSGNDRLVVWELNDSHSEYIGKQRVAPAYIRVRTGAGSSSAIDYLVFSSGYDSVKTGLLFVDMFYKGSTCANGGSFSTFTPCIVSELDVTAEDPWGYGRKDVFGVVTPISNSSVNAVGLKYNAVYWGDIFGNVWKMDLDAFATAGGSYAERYYDVSKWGKDGFEPKIIFKAYDTNKVAQPITTRIAAAAHPYGGIGLIFGTGGLWTSADHGSVSLKYDTTQTLYMIRDNSPESYLNASAREVTNLIRRCDSPVDAKNNPSAGCLMQYVFAADDKTRIIVNPAIHPDNSTKVYGWYLDLADGDGQSFNEGARIYRNPIIVNSYNISVPVNMPNVNDTCNGGGTSYIVQGDWTLTDFNMELSRSETYTGLLSEGRVYSTKDGLKTVYSTDEAGPDGSVGDPPPGDTPERVISGASWMKMY